MLSFAVYIASLTEFLEEFISLGGFYLSPFRIIVFAFFVRFAIRLDWTRMHVFLKERASRIYLASVVLLLGVVFLSAWYSPDRVYSIKRFLNSFTYFTFPFVFSLALYKVSKRTSTVALVIKTSDAIIYSGLIASLFAYVQAATGFMLKTPELRPVFGIMTPRVNSLFLDKNFFAFFIIFPIWLLLQRMNGRRISTGLLKKMVMLMLMLGALLMTSSRGGLVTFGGLVMMGLVAKWRPGLSYFLELMFLIFMPVLVVLYGVLNFENALDVMSAVDVESDSGSSRLFAWYSGIQLYLTSPILGVGPGNFVMLDKGVVLEKFGVASWVADDISALAGHSNVLELFVECGPFALSAYLLMNISIYRIVFNLSKRFPQVIPFRHLFVAASIGCSFVTYYPWFLAVFIGVIIYLNSVVSRDAYVCR